MKKKYFPLFIFLILFAFTRVNLNAQCNLAAPVVTGNTLVCNSNGTFTLNATTPASLTTAWYAIPEGGNALATGSSFTSPNLTAGTYTYYTGQNTSVSTTSITQPPHVTTILAMSRGYWFVAPVSFIITGIRVPMEASQGIPSMAIIKLNAPPPTYPTVTNAFTTLYLNQLANTGAAIAPCYVPVFAGDVIGVLGDRNDTTSYSPNPYSGMLGASPITLTRMGMLFNLSTNVPQDIWTESINNIGRVEIYTTLGCLSTLTPVPVVVSVPPQVTITGPPGTICSGATTTLMAGGADAYNWTAGPGTSTYAIAPGSTTSYFVLGTNLAGCSNNASIQVTVTPLPNVMISTTNSIICLGQTGTLTLSGASTYTWSTGFNNPTFQITPVVTTSYSAGGTDANGCMNTATISIPVSPLPTVTASSSKSIICVGQAVTLNASGASTYSWSTGAQTQSIVVSPTTNTSFIATGTNSVGCSKSFVVPVSVLPCVGINENNIDGHSVTIFPNPTQGHVTLKSTEPITHLQIKDVMGKTITDQPFEGLTEMDLNIETLPAGIYFMTIRQAQGERILRLVKE
ncbi:MAG: T9SS type A sorting domain-containing protein [Bacteroidota bacterium]